MGKGGGNNWLSGYITRGPGQRNPSVTLGGNTATWGREGVSASAQLPNPAVAPTWIRQPPPGYAIPSPGPMRWPSSRPKSLRPEKNEFKRENDPRPQDTQSKARDRRALGRAVRRGSDPGGVDACKSVRRVRTWEGREHSAVDCREEER
ncbi:hypothetical protein BV22DRAFT_1052490 [Leucogyrophana mollusca]|uniref:Uncharacterized protein n=1 Tax=Leucogyrophana mollusca TaxID=85980 RepID=A0ACB8AVW6_9AGAM|nr:hypothetical protein BV22DRAFT_1052490 [Leucogyrophana mollusca]